MRTFHILPLCALLSVCVSEPDWEVSMLSSVITAMEKPSSVIATLCWPAYKKLQLVLILSGNAVTVQFSKPDDNAKPGGDPYILFVLDLACPDISTYTEAAKEQKLFRFPCRWIFIDSDEKRQFIVPEVLCKFDILPDSEVMVASSAGNGYYEFRYIYKTSVNATWSIEMYGTWDTQNKLQISSQVEDSTAFRRKNLAGAELSICYVLTDSDSIHHLTDGYNDHVDTITKVNFPTTNQLMDFLNASRKYVFVNTWGYNDNGTWNGMTGYLVREEVEIGGSPMFFTTERQPLVEYIASPTPTRSKFVFQQPKLSYENNLFLLSFRTSVWYSTIMLLFLLFLALLAVAKWEWSRTKHDEETRNRDAGVLRGDTSDVLLLIFGATCQQGSPVELKGSLGRVVMLVLFLALMFLYTSYSANIVALLQSSSSGIRTLEDLLGSRIKFGVHDNVFNRHYFSTATEPIRKAIYETKVAPRGSKPRFMTLEEGVKNMQKGLFAFHMETGVGYKFVGKYFHEGEKCGLEEIQYLQVIDPWLAVRKNTPYMEMFKIGLKRIQEHGLQKRENEMLYEKRPKCSGRESNFISVSMVDCYPALLVLSYGAIIAVFLLCLEILYKKKLTMKKNMLCPCINMP